MKRKIPIHLWFDRLRYLLCIGTLIFMHVSPSLKASPIAEAFVPVQQSRNVTGTITGENGETLPGVSILVKGTTTGAVTDVNGRYTLNVPPEDILLVISSIGYVTQEVPLNGRSVIDITLLEDVQSLEEIVVVGYGAQKKVTVTGSVATISNKELKASPSLNLTNSIGGLMPGVITKMPSGEPGRDNASILIRGRNTTGDNSPLVVVDGIQGVQGWERINPNDIESISVLKDASAAIYGARAANGVILITTKRGQIGKPLISYSFNQGITQPTRLPKMASSADFAQYVNQLDLEAGQTPRYTDAEIELFRNGTDPNYVNEDWYGTVLKNSSTQSQHNLNVRGGTENVKYSVSGSHTNEGSIFENGSLNFKTYSIRNNVDAQLNKNLKVGFDLNGGLEDGNYPAYSTSATFGFLKQTPMQPVYWPNGLPSPGIEYGINPAITGSALTGNRNTKTYRYLAKASFDLALPVVKGLEVDGYVSYNHNNTLDKNWETPWTVYDYDKTNDTYISRPGGRIAAPQLNQMYIGLTNTLVNLRIKYELNLNDHTLNTFVAAEQSEDVYADFGAFRKNYISSSIDELFAGGLTDQSTSGKRSESGRKNLFGRISYGYKDKYLLDFNARYDGSSNFPKGKQYGFFPGLSVAWRVDQENFIKNSGNLIDNLKIRASVGRIGNDAIAAFQHLRLYTLGNTGMSYGSPQVATNGLVAGVTPNPNITWEVGTTSNIGMDASFRNGIIGFTLDIYKQTRSNILTTRDLAVPRYTGIALPNENIGVVENKGFELELNHQKTAGDLSWRVAGNISYSRNNVVEISESANIVEWKKQEGHVLGAMQYYHALGIFRTQEQVDAAPVYPGTRVGDLQYEDLDGDGRISANDMRTLDKTNTPQVVFGLNLSMNYRNFSLWANFSGATNVWQYYHVNARTSINQLEDVIVNRYTPGSMDSKYPRLPTVEYSASAGEPSGLPSDFWLIDSSFGRLKTLELAYNLPEEFLSRFKIQSMRLYLNGQNLFTIDNVKWADPENTSQTAAYYPQSKIYNLGINLTF